MTLPSSYFDNMYAESADPWGFAGRWYEERKRALTLALLPEQHYETVFEPGCSIGILTHALAQRAGALLATDIAEAAISAARERCSELPHVQIRRLNVLDWPASSFDLVVLSEVLYYLTLTDATAVAGDAMRSADTIVAVHWRHRVADYPMTGDTAHVVLAKEARRQQMTELATYTDADLRAAVWSRDPRSVARRTGVT